MRRRLRIAAFSAVDLSLPHGHALHLRGLLDALAARGHEVALLTPCPSGKMPATRFRRIAIPVLRLGVLVHWSFELLGGVRLLLHCLRGRPHLVYARQDLYTTAPAVVSRLLRIPLALEVNASLPVEASYWGKPRVQRIVAFCERFTVRRASIVLVLSGGLGRDVVARTGCDPERIAVAPIATHLPRLSEAIPVRTDHGVAPETFLVGFAGNLSSVQGCDILIDALGRLPAEASGLWIIGAGHEAGRLRGRAAALGGRVRFFGGVAREEADRLLRACQILVAPYRGPEFERIYGGAVSTKVLTYLALDRPVLVTDLPSYRWIEAIGAGGTFDSGDAGALARAIETWRARWIEAGCPLEDWPWQRPGPGRRHVEGEGTWEHAAARVEELLERLVTSATR